MTRVLLLNGPNLGRLGVREPEVYGSLSFADLVESGARWGSEFGLEVEVRQTDDESELVHWLHEAVDTRSDVVLNPAAFTHYSYALRDAAAQVTKGDCAWSRCTSPTPTPGRSSVISRSSGLSPRGPSRGSVSTRTGWRCSLSPAEPLG